ncbi:hypothetical protein GCM10010512_27620 [Streptomyces thermoviolaceus subsp. thermoviolaceus]|nr:hypothetical protein GCM10010499_35860 [Streptomyces thermoviolaceus subsp. apingens]GHA94639.1 hypothetical protein GCM10010512_27620 [Streptomyces thermoviolaceus subsp. thermoviolaceus]
MWRAHWTGRAAVVHDGHIINVAVPVIGRKRSTSLTGIQWMTDGRALVFAEVLLTRGCTGRPVAQPAGLLHGRCGVHGVVGRVRTRAERRRPAGGPLLEGLGAALIVPGS